MRRTSILGLVAGAVLVIFIFIIVAITGASNGFKDCYTGTTGLVGNGTATSPPGTDNTLFAKFQAQSTFSDADRQEQRTNAALIVSIGQKRGFSDRDIAIAVATAIQESNLINQKNHGKLNDHTSLGLFQQQVSVRTYGTADDILNTSHATNAFYDRLTGVAGRDLLPMIDVAIKIQIPNLNAYYARWKWDDLAKEIVGIYKNQGLSVGNTTNICAQNAGVYTSSDAHLPVDPGFSVSFGGAFNDPNYPGAKPHKGTDLVFGSHSRGKPVYAAFSGVVIASGIGKDCRAGAAGDNTVTILTPKGFTIGYMHMNGADITVHIGDHVGVGQQIGAIGSCGEATGPHVHFEVSPGTDLDYWISLVPSVRKYGQKWLDPVAFMAHYGIKL